MVNEGDTLHSGQIHALRTVCSMLLAREMKREGRKLTEIPEGFIKGLGEDLERAGLADNFVAQEIEAAYAHELQLIFRQASIMCDLMER